MTAPAGSELGIAWGFESADRLHQGYDTVNGLPNGIYVRSLGGVHAKGTFERNDNLSARRAPKKGRFGRFPIAPKLAMRPDVDSICRFMAHFDNVYDITDLTGAYQWDTEPRIAGDTANATYIDSFSAEFDSGDGRPVLHMGNRIPGWNLKIQDGKLVDFTMDWLGCRDTYVGDVDEVAVNAAFTGRWIAYGHRNDADTATTAVKIKCTTAGVSGAAKVKLTLGAVAYGATEYTVTYGTPIRVVDAAGARVGISRMDDFYIVCLDAAATGSALTLNDEWTIPAVRTQVAPTFSALNPLMTAGVTVTINSVEYALKNVDIAASYPRHPFFGTQTAQGGGLYARTIQNAGRRTLRFTFDRDADDLVIFHLMKEATSFTVQVDMYGDPIGATAYDERWKIYAAAAQVTGLDRDVANEDTLPEKIEVEAFDDGTNKLYTQSIWCTQSAI